jgi:hypothetical protein
MPGQEGTAGSYASFLSKPFPYQRKLFARFVVAHYLLPPTSVNSVGVEIVRGTTSAIDVTRGGY